jgi:hypothetical protein
MNCQDRYYALYHSIDRAPRLSWILRELIDTKTCDDEHVLGEVRSAAVKYVEPFFLSKETRSQFWERIMEGGVNEHDEFIASYFVITHREVIKQRLWWNIKLSTRIKYLF